MYRVGGPGLYFHIPLSMAGGAALVYGVHCDMPKAGDQADGDRVSAGGFTVYPVPRACASDGVVYAVRDRAGEGGAVLRGYRMGIGVFCSRQGNNQGSFPAVRGEDVVTGGKKTGQQDKGAGS
jgi:hypothetical protein